MGTKILGLYWTPFEESIDISTGVTYKDTYTQIEFLACYTISRTCQKINQKIYITRYSITGKILRYPLLLTHFPNAEF